MVVLVRLLLMFNGNCRSCKLIKNRLYILACNSCTIYILWYWLGTKCKNLQYDQKFRRKIIFLLVKVKKLRENFGKLFINMFGKVNRILFWSTQATNCRNIKLKICVALWWNLFKFPTICRYNLNDGQYTHKRKPKYYCEISYLKGQTTHC